MDANTKVCPSCKQSIPVDAAACPRCGAEIPGSQPESGSPGEAAPGKTFTRGDPCLFAAAFLVVLCLLAQAVWYFLPENLKQLLPLFH